MILAIQIYLCCWFFCNFQPVQSFIQDRNLFAKNNWWTNAIFDLLTCQYCQTLWVTLAITWNPFVALAASMVAQIHTKIIK